MEEANDGRQSVMADSRGKNVSRHRGKTGWWAAAFAHPHSIRSHCSLFNIFLMSGRSGKDINVKKVKQSLPNFSNFTSMGVFHQEKIS